MAEMSWQGDWVAVEAPPRRIDARMLGVSLLAGAGAAAWFALANTFDAVREFGGSLTALGSATPYASTLPTLVAWMLVVTSVLVVVPGVPAGVRPGLRFGVFALVTGAFLEVIGALCSLWESGLTSGQVVVAPSTIATCFDLLRASSILGIAALLLFSTGALLLRPRRTRDRSDSSNAAQVRTWRVSCGVLALAFVAGAVQQGYLLFTLFTPVPPPYQVQTLLSGVPAACMWLGLALAMTLISRALIRSTNRRFSTCARLGSLGFSLLSAASLLQILYYEVIRTQPTSSLAELLAKSSSASTCAAYLVLTAGLVAAAALLLAPRASTRDALRALALHRGAHATVASR